MKRRKKIILIALLTIVVLAGSIGGVALAQTDENNNQTNTILDRVTNILVDKGVNITSEQLKDAFTQAGKDIRDETLDKYLQNLIEEGKINDQQAEDYKAWLESRPDVPLQLGPGNHGGIRQFGGGFRSFGGFNGGFHGWCEPEATE
jgi:hypothetical protein